MKIVLLTFSLIINSLAPVWAMPEIENQNQFKLNWNYTPIILRQNKNSQLHFKVFKRVMWLEKLQIPVIETSFTYLKNPEGKTDLANIASNIKKSFKSADLIITGGKNYFHVQGPYQLMNRYVDVELKQDKNSFTIITSFIRLGFHSQLKSELKELHNSLLTYNGTPLEKKTSYINWIRRFVLDEVIAQVNLPANPLISTQGNILVSPTASIPTNSIPSAVNIPSGTVIPSGTNIPSGTTIPSGVTIPSGTTLPSGITIPSLVTGSTTTGATSAINSLLTSAANPSSLGSLSGPSPFSITIPGISDLNDQVTGLSKNIGLMGTGMGNFNATLATVGGDLNANLNMANGTLKDMSATAANGVTVLGQFNGTAQTAVTNFTTIGTGVNDNLTATNQILNQFSSTATTAVSNATVIGNNFNSNIADLSTNLDKQASNIVALVDSTTGRVTQLIDTKTNTIITSLDTNVDKSLRVFDNRTGQAIGVFDTRTGQALTLAEKTVDLTNQRVIDLTKVANNGVATADKAVEYANQRAIDFNKTVNDNWSQSNKLIGQFLDPNHMAKVAYYTAAGAALGSLSVGIIVQGLSAGFSILREFLTGEKEKQVRWEQFGAAMNAWEKQLEDLGKFESIIDNLIAAFQYFDSEKLGNNYIEELKKAKRKMAFNQREFLKKADDMNFGESCRQLYYDASEELGDKIKEYDKILAVASNRTKPSNLKNRDYFCDQLSEIKDKLIQAEKQMQDYRLAILAAQEIFFEKQLEIAKNNNDKIYLIKNDDYRKHKKREEYKRELEENYEDYLEEKRSEWVGICMSGNNPEGVEINREYNDTFYGKVKSFLYFPKKNKCKSKFDSLYKAELVKQEKKRRELARIESELAEGKIKINPYVELKVGEAQIKMMQKLKVDSICYQFAHEKDENKIPKKCNEYPETLYSMSVGKNYEKAQNAYEAQCKDAYLEGLKKLKDK